MTPLTEMAKELVQAAILAQGLSPDASRALLRRTFNTLQGLQTESGDAETEAEPAEALPDWRASITRHTIRCLECGETFKQLTIRHLRVHGLDTQSYRQKYGIPHTQSLLSREMSKRRRELAQQNRPWEQSPGHASRSQP